MSLKVTRFGWFTPRQAAKSGVSPTKLAGTGLAQYRVGRKPEWRPKNLPEVVTMRRLEEPMSEEMTDPTRTVRRLHRADGFSAPELLIVVAIVVIVSSFAVMTFRTSNKNLQLAGVTRTFSGYLEKARLDSIRRHGGATININSATSYTVNMDFDGTGSATARTINLPTGASISYTLPPAATTLNPSSNPVTVTYDWRGRAGTTVLLTFTDSTSGVGTKNLVIGTAGDISAETTVTGPVTTPTPQTSVSTSSGIKSMH